MGGSDHAYEPGDNPRCITRSVSAPGATIRAMLGDLNGHMHLPGLRAALPLLR